MPSRGQANYYYCQLTDEEVGSSSHRLVSKHCVDDAAVTDEAENEYEREDDRYHHSCNEDSILVQLATYLSILTSCTHLLYCHQRRTSL